jgi:catechol 2,3-dioxygenase-like lactoylglutathione lyase family enzyme
VTSLFHTGVAVSNLEDSVRVLEKYFGFTASSRRLVEHEYIGNLIGVSNAVVEIAMLEIGDGNLLELLEWRARPNTPPLPLNADLNVPKVHHICIYVNDAAEWHSKLSKASEIKLITNEPVIVPIGPNAGSKVFFALVLNEIYFEIFQRI